MRLKPKQQQLPCEVKPVLKNVSLQLDCNSIVDILLRHLSPSIPCGLNSKTSSKYPQLYIHMKFLQAKPWEILLVVYATRITVMAGY